MKKNGIFVVSNEDFKLRYNTLKLIDDLKKNVHMLFVTYDKGLSQTDMELLASFSDYQIVFDKIEGSSIKYYVKSLLYIKDMKIDYNCEEWVLMDNSVLGPFFPISELICKCDEKEIDFWGVYYQPTWRTEDNDLINDYIPSFICGMRNSFFINEKFGKFAECVLIDQSYSRREFDHYWLSQMRHLGVKIGLTQKLCSPSEDIDKNYGIFEYRCDSIITNKKFPFLDKDVLRDTYSANGSLKKLIYRLSDNDYYDIGKLKAELIRTLDVREVFNCFKTKYILPLSYELDGKYNSNSVALFIHLYYADLIEEYIPFIQQVPAFIKIFITVSLPETYNKLEELKTKKKLSYTILQIENRGRDIAAFLVGCKNIINKYNIIGFVHDKKTSGNFGSSIRGSLFSEDVWSNCLGSKEYILNILKLFESHPMLGFLSPPFPKFYDYWNLLGREWTTCFEEAQRLCNRLQLDVPLSIEKSPIAFSNSFWCRSEILEPLLLLNLEYNDFPEEPLGYDGTINHAIERIYPYCAQSKGYYSGIIENNIYAENELISFSQRVAKLNKRINDLESHINELEVRNNEVGIEYQNLQKHDADVSAHIKVLENRNQYVEQQYIELQRHDADVSAHIKILEDRNHYVESENIEIQSRLEETLKNIRILEETNNYIQQELTDFRERVDKFIMVNQELELQNQILSDKIIEMEKVAALYKIWDGNNAIKNIVNRGVVGLSNNSISRDDKMVNFVRGCDRVYIYGAGKKAMRIADEMKKKGLPFEAFVVSNNQKKMTELLGYPVKYISEINFGIKEGVVVALNLANAKDALGYIINSNIENIYFAK